MKKKQHTNFTKTLSSLLMLLLLAWLTVCLPYINESRQTAKVHVQLSGEETPDADDSNPLTNTNEEKSESGVSFLSEYLHHLFHLDHTISGTSSAYNTHSADLYLAYHPELIIPPPEA